MHIIGGSFYLTEVKQVHSIVHKFLFYYINLSELSLESCGCYDKLIGTQQDNDCGPIIEEMCLRPFNN